MKKAKGDSVYPWLCCAYDDHVSTLFKMFLEQLVQQFSGFLTKRGVAADQLLSLLRYNGASSVFSALVALNDGKAKLLFTKSYDFPAFTVRNPHM